MLKKLAIFSLVAALAPAALAMGTAPAPKPFFNGFYVGGAMGVTNILTPFEYSTTVQTTNNLVVPVIGVRLPPFVVSAEAKTRVGFDNFGLGLVGGYGRTLNNWYLGAEVTGKYIIDGSKASTAGAGVTVALPAPQADAGIGVKVSHSRAWMDWDFGLLAKVGWIPANLFPARNVMFYALVGTKFSRFNVKGATVELTPFVGPYHVHALANVTNGFKKWDWAFAPGIGAAVALTHNLFVNMQYLYAFYGDVTHTDSYPTYMTTATGIPAYVHLKTRISPRTNTVTLGVNWIPSWNV